MSSKTKPLHEIASDYARSMASNPKLALEVPEEWDFREIVEDELADAVCYEYAREHSAFRKEASAWLDMSFRKKTVREHLLSGVLPQELEYALEDVGTMHIYWKYRVWITPLYPVPWLGFEPEDRLAIAKDNSWEPSAVAIKPLTEKEAIQCANFAKQFGPHKYALKVDFKTRKTQDIIRDFAVWARGEAKKQKRASGKASAAPWQKLKRLAAYRLHRAGLNHEAAQKLSSERSKVFRVNNTADVLPCYNSKGAWHKAWKAAETDLNQFRP